MKHYALIFYATRTFTPEEQKPRAVDIAGWVKKVTEMGITLDPRNFGDTLATFALMKLVVLGATGGTGIEAHGYRTTFAGLVSAIGSLTRNSVRPGCDSKSMVPSL